MALPEPNKILVVDDEASLRYFLAEELESQGYQVYTVADGREALNLLQKTVMDLAIIDLQMPGLNGLELMTAMQALPDPPELIMLTAHATLETSIAAMRRGSSDFLLKPYDVNELLQSVKRVMAHRYRKLQQRMAARLLANSLGLMEISQEETTEAKEISGPVPVGTIEPVPVGTTGPGPVEMTEPGVSSTCFRARGLTLEIESMTVFKDSRALSLTPTEFRLLTILMKYPDQPHTFQALAEVTHSQQIDLFEARDLLKSSMGRLRQKLGRTPDGGAYIANVRGVGYKFIGS